MKNRSSRFVAGMKNNSVRVALTSAVVAFMVLAVQGCGDDKTAKPVQFAAPAMVGSLEVPGNSSTGTGQFVMTVNPAMTEAQFTLTVNGLNNVFQAHLHQGAPGTNGPIFLWLYPQPTPQVAGPANAGPTNGQIAFNTAHASDLVGPMAGKTIADLVAAVQAGQVYINVHTSGAGLGIPSGQPGNIPGGEIRQWLVQVTTQ